MIFSARLKQLRNEKELTQQDLADVLSVGRATIAGYETKGKQPDYEKLTIIADYFNVTIDYLLGKTDNPTTVVIEHEKLPKELREIGVEYLVIAKEMADKEIPPEDVRKILDVLANRKK